METLADLLVYVGFLRPASAQAEVATKLHDRIAAIIKLTRQIHKMIGEDIISRDLQVYSVEEGRSFDKATMMDAFEEDSSRKFRKSSPKGPSICTIGLGLCTKSSNVTSQGSDRVVLMKATVVIESHDQGY